MQEVKVRRCRAAGGNVRGGAVRGGGGGCGEGGGRAGTDIQLYSR